MITSNAGVVTKAKCNTYKTAEYEFLSICLKKLKLCSIVIDIYNN